MDFDQKASRPVIFYIGVSLELYLQAMPPEVLEQWDEAFDLWQRELSEFADVAFAKLCFTDDDVAGVVKEAEHRKPDAVVLSAVSYTPSSLICPALEKLGIPVIIWNTQFAERIMPDFSRNDLNLNHTVQGIQDITNILYRRKVRYSIVSGHWRDPRCREFLKRELNAVKAAGAAGNIHVLELGGKFKGMGDFEYDPDMLERVWGVKSSSIDPEKFIAESAAVAEDELETEIAADRDKFTISDRLEHSVLSDAVRRKIVLRKMLKENNANAFTMNFSSLCHIKNFGQLPFYAINTLMSEGMGYAGEGDVMRAALMRQCYELCGDANFTEIYTVDFPRNLMLMSHMQECNINIAGGKEKRKLFHKEFWMENISGYPGMFFTSEPGDYTVVSITPTPGENNMRLISFEGTVPELPVLDKYDVPYWLLQPDTPVEKLLDRYSIAGGPHHLSAVPGRRSGDFARLAFWLGFEFADLDR